ncbi:S8 family serine peptidase [Sulfidibacter corallicola]|uniref:S8 family serine peptidase n=1 Tax=Sulfidibacter corallicola TaxID=2818388 RepID=A0A8A4TPB3_SULCO|nr:S8 family serine peptidase [Sulfidibacter corallicola]QTD50741.1 S8 family serine peptidase [Sulfidibacter corallicola]
MWCLNIGIYLFALGRKPLSLPLVWMLITMPATCMAFTETSYVYRLGPALRVLYRLEDTNKGISEKKAAENWQRAWSTVAGLTGNVGRINALKKPSETYLPVLIDFHGDRARLAQSGFKIQTGIGSIYSGTISLDRLHDLAALEGLDQARMSQLMKAIWRPVNHPGPAVPYPTRAEKNNIPMDAGAGTIVGYLDTGVDIFHRDFRKADGTTRILYILDLSLPGDTDGDGLLDGPGPFGGTLFTRAQINDALANSSDFPSIDTTGHGTHGLSIAAGSTPEMPGMAPGADLIVVKGTRHAGTLDFESSDIINGLAFIDEMAGTHPYVINLSLGTMFSGHDGRALEERAIDALVGEGKPGKAVVIAAGNASDNHGTRFRHFQGKAYTGQWNEHILHVPEYSFPQPGTGNDLVVVQILFDSNDQLSLRITAPDGKTQVSIGGFEHVSRDTPFGRIFLSTMGRNSGGGEAIIMIHDDLYNAPAAGDWRLEVHGARINAGGHYHGWLSDFSLVGGLDPYLTGAADNHYLIGKPATAYNGIAVGSFAEHIDSTRFRTAWTDINGTDQADTSAFIGDISEFSSPGKTRDGRFKPDTTAPGELVIGAVSRAAFPGTSPHSIYLHHKLDHSEALIISSTSEGNYGVLEGTSFAAPVVTGLVARLLSRDPGLDAIQARNMVIQSSWQDDFTDFVPNPEWGFGKVDLTLGLNDILHHNIRIETVALAHARMDDEYSHSLVASGGTKPYTWSILDGELPPGFELSHGLITGNGEKEGNWSFTIMVQDGSPKPQIHSKELTLQVIAYTNPTIISDHIKVTQKGRRFRQTLLAKGGVPPYSWHLWSGILPEGIDLRPDGTLIGYTKEEGEFSFTIEILDKNEMAFRKSYNLNVIGENQGAWRFEGTSYPELRELVIDPSDPLHMLALLHSYETWTKETWDGGETWDTIGYDLEANLAISPADGSIWASRDWRVPAYFNRIENRWEDWYFCDDYDYRTRAGALEFSTDGRLFAFFWRLQCRDQKVVLDNTVATIDISGIVSQGEKLPYPSAVGGFRQNMSLYRADPEHMYLSAYVYGSCIPSCPDNSISVYSQDGGHTWDNIPVENIYEEIEISQTDPGDIIKYEKYLSESNKLMKSTDYGQTWADLYIPDVYSISSIVRDDDSASRMMASTSKGILLSKDGGISWRNITTENVRRSPRDPVFDGPGLNRVFIWSRHYGLLQSDDDGANWQQKNSGLLSMPLSGIAINENNPKELLIPSRDVFLTRSSGNTWVRTDRRGSDPYFNTLPEIAFSEPNRYYYVYYDGVWRSDNRGITWYQPNPCFGNGLNNKAARLVDFAVDPFDENRLVSLDEDGFSWISIDGGVRWEQMMSPCRPCSYSQLSLSESSLIFSKVKQGKLLASFDRALYKTDDYGRNWELIKTLSWPGYPDFAIEASGIDPEFIYAAGPNRIHSYNPYTDLWHDFFLSARALSVAIDPSNPLVAYVGCDNGGGVYKTESAGESWFRIDNGVFDNQDINGLVHHPTDSGILYASSNREGVYRTIDGGDTWDNLRQFSSVADQINISTRALGNTETIYVGTQGFGVQVSSDSGQSFEPRVAGLDNFYVNALQLDPDNPNTLYAGTEDGLYITNDQGLTWLPTSLTRAPISDIAIDRGTKPRRIYLVSLTDGLFISEDGGLSFVSSNQGLSSQILTALEIQSNGGRTRIWVGMHGGDGVAWSDNGGVDWFSGAGNGFTDHRVNDLIVDPVLVGRIWIAGSSGVYYSDDLGDHWTPHNAGLPAGVPATSLSFDPQSGALLASFSSEVAGGVFRGGNQHGAWQPYSGGLTSLKVTHISRETEGALRSPDSPLLVHTSTAGGGLFATVLDPPEGEAPNILTATLPRGSNRETYHAALVADGGVHPHVWSLVERSLPPGLGLSPETGEISGLPVQPGFYSFDIQVTSANKISHRKTFSIEIADEDPPQLLQGPGDASACLKGEASFFVFARASGDLAYQWRKDGFEIQGARNPSYTISSVVSSDSGSYDCLVSNQFGSLTSNSARLTVSEPISIVTHPVELTACTEESACFSVTTGSNDVLTYQWQLNGHDIGGANEPNFCIDSVTTNDSGAYRCIVSNPCFASISNPAGLTVHEPIDIVSQPVGQAACLGDQVNINVVVTGTEPMSYFWQKDGIDIPDATGPSLVLDVGNQSDAGEYRCIVTNPCGAFSSNSVMLTVNEPVTLTLQPRDIIICPGEDLTWCVAASGSEPLFYQWYKNGSPVALTPCISFRPVAVSDEEVYVCEVSNVCGSRTSTPVTLTADGPLAAMIQSPGALGLDPPLLEARISCSRPPFSLTWENNMTGAITSQNPLLLDPLPEATTSFNLTVSDETETVSIQTTILVALDPLYRDVNGDGCNTLTDLYLLIQDWLYAIPNDPNGDGFIDVRDLLYVNVSDPEYCNP